MRRFFNTDLRNNGADIFFTDFLMGHKIDQVHGAYFKEDAEMLKERYMRYLLFFLASTDTVSYKPKSMESSRQKTNP